MSQKRSKVSDKYVKLDPVEHVLKRPNMYIGSIEKDSYLTWIYDEEQSKMVRRTLSLYQVSTKSMMNLLLTF